MKTKRIFSFVLPLLILVASLFAQVTQVFAALSYGSGVYTNLCGTSYSATADTCNGGCNPSTGSCSSNGNYVVRFECDGRLGSCTSKESSFASSQSFGATCGKTQQIDVFNKTCRTSGGQWVCGDGDLKDYMVWYSGDCSNSTPTPTPGVTPPPSPTPSPTPTPTPTLISSCDSLQTVSGNNKTIPSTVTLRARGSDNLGNIQKYRFYFGDGSQTEQASAEVSHQYTSSGTYIARADVQDSKGNWKTSSSCQVTVSVEPSNTESHRSDCSDLFINTGNYTQAPTTVSFTLTGYDNKGGIQQYKLDFGNGVVKEQSGGSFEQQYSNPGTYTVKGWIKDSEGNWKGGENSCTRTVYAYTKPLESQPKTGSSTGMTAAALVAGGLGIALIKLKHALLKK